jgi:LPXTG-site transpeptidase (sortase) family protein
VTKQHHDKHLPASNRQRYLSLAVAIVLAVIGIGLISYFFISQKSAPQPPASAANNTSSQPKPKPKQPKHDDTDAPAPSTKTLGFSRPENLSIPSIHVNEKVTIVGKQADGSADFPKGAHVDQPAWYKYSPAPGEYGAAVIMGHVDTIKSGPSVFFNLGKLKSGEKVMVTRADGKTVVFTISHVQSYPKSEFPTNKVYSAQANGAELRLITCGGAYNQKAHHYTKNIVVSASLTTVKT